MVPTALTRLAARQGNAVSRGQCLSSGLTRDRLAGLVASGRWQRVHLGVFVTFSGPLPDETRVWAALLACGPDAAASHETALWLATRKGVLGRTINVAVVEKQVVRRPHDDIRVHRMSRLEVLATRPPRVSPERALLDVIHVTPELDKVVGLVCDVVGSRRTSLECVRVELAARPRQKWRPQLKAMLAGVEIGAESPLELLDLSNCRAHGLPAGERQVKRRGLTADQWLDVSIVIPGTEEHVVKELDGRLGHEGTGRFRDMKRDNGTSLSGGRPIRFGWVDLFVTPCEAAAFEALLYTRLGWDGRPKVCGSDCIIEPNMLILEAEFPWLTTEQVRSGG